MKVLVIDIGGMSVKILATGQTDPRHFESGKKMTPRKMVAGVKKLARDWDYDVVSIGYPGVVTKGQPTVEPHNLARGWIAFDYKAAFGCPVKILNDAAMQALGSYKSGLMLFLGLGTGLGSALVNECSVVPLELAHLSYKRSTYEDYMGTRGLERDGVKEWRRHVVTAVERLIQAFHPDDVVLGGGNSHRFKKLPAGCRRGDNANAFVGGFRMWEETRSKKKAAYGPRV
jgi:predicted NBD/HSP70 family sugar kinase